MHSILQITEVDDDDCQINFLVEAGKYGNVQIAYKLHINRDEMWVEKADILLVLQQLEEDVLKSRTFFKINKDDEKKIGTLFRNRNSTSALTLIHLLVHCITELDASVCSDCLQVFIFYHYIC